LESIIVLEPKKVATTDEHEEKGWSKGSERGQEATSDTCRGVSDCGYGLDNGTWGHLAKGHDIEELALAHPMIGRDGVMLHEGNNDKTSAIGEGANFQSHPSQGTDARGSSHAKQEYRVET
jgi:hypothetical protein